MSEANLRPRYKFTCPDDAVEIRAKLLNALKQRQKNPRGFQQQSVANHVIISLPQKERHFWSPTLDVNLEDAGKGQTTVRVLIGPAPAVWTMFMFGYAIAALLAISGLILGYAQFILEQNSWTFVFTPIGLVLATVLYLAGLAGKYRAQAEMELLKNFVEQALSRPLFPLERENESPKPFNRPESS